MILSRDPDLPMIEMDERLASLNRNGFSKVLGVKAACLHGFGL